MPLKRVVAGLRAFALARIYGRDDSSRARNDVCNLGQLSYMVM
jgi:hypothetical protein